MKIGQKFKIKPEAENVQAWFDTIPYEKIKDKIGEFIGINKNTNLPVLDFGPVGPFNFTVECPEQFLQEVPQ